ncbi:MAG: LPS export ABC transporter permease LptF [Xanthobacteraceae bacterium]
MGSIDRYIFRHTLGAFLLVLVSLTSIIWITQALRDIDLMTSQGQSMLVFIGITGLVIPQLMLVIAPIALVIAVAHVLNKLATDSEIIVMNAAGMSPWRLFRSFFSSALLVALMVVFVAAYLSPKCLRELRRWATEVRADLVTNIVQPGRFITIENGLVFHLRERQPNGLLLGIFLDDRRNPDEESTFLAEKGEIVENDDGTFLVLVDGSVQRHQGNQRDPNIVKFERYAFDLSQFSNPTQSQNLSVRELYLWELASPSPNDPTFKQFPNRYRAELHDRIVAPFYPIAFTAIAFAWLGAPSTTRQSRAMAIVAMILGVFGLRVIGFASSVIGINAPIVLAGQYVALAAVMWISLRMIARGTAVEPPARLTNWITSVSERMSRRFATT